MKIEVSIDPAYQEPKIIILTDKWTDEISGIVKRLNGIYSVTALSATL
ncbi:hypothetical protein [Paenibacillus sp. 1001270B_150601_E10]|nr:hypothetical protein [Paenibacillus sp. 1001270B_150601_E10]